MTTIKSEKMEREKILKKIEEKKLLWIKKKIKTDKLTKELESLFSTIEKDNEYENAKKIIEDIILLDKNVNESTLLSSNLIISMIVAVFAIYSLFSNFISQDINKIASLVIVLAIVIMTSKTALKHAGKYPREKSFYQIVIKRM